jgi:3-oxoacyl-ACP reductase-like protein
VITRRGRGVAAKDWLFVGLLVSALGITASMLLSYRSAPKQETAASPATTVEHAVNAATTPTGVAPAQQPVAANVTEITSNPPNAEVVYGGAVIGNTPLRVARADFNADYLLRLSGHESQLVRVTAASPGSILITLKPVH